LDLQEKLEGRLNPRRDSRELKKFCNDVLGDALSDAQEAFQKLKEEQNREGGPRADRLARLQQKLETAQQVYDECWKKRGNDGPAKAKKKRAKSDDSDADEADPRDDYSSMKNALVEWNVSDFGKLWTRLEKRAEKHKEWIDGLTEVVLGIWGRLRLALNKIWTSAYLVDVADDFLVAVKHPLTKLMVTLEKTEQSWSKDILTIKYRNEGQQLLQEHTQRRQQLLEDHSPAQPQRLQLKYRS
jgi:hypothetical protein